MKDVAQNVTEDELGAAKDGSVKVLIVKAFNFPIFICKLITHVKQEPRRCCSSAESGAAHPSRRVLRCPSPVLAAGTWLLAARPPRSAQRCPSPVMADGACSIDTKRGMCVFDARVLGSHCPCLFDRHDASRPQPLNTYALLSL